MNDKQPEALRLADEVDEVAQTFPDMAEVSAMIRTQHAALERKDALLRRALGALKEYAEYDHCAWLSDAITKELQ